MKLSASPIILMLVSMLVLASAENRRQLKSRKGKSSKKRPQPPVPPQPQPQCETIEVYYLLDYDNDCVKVTNPFEGRDQYVGNAIGGTGYYAIYGPPDKDGFFTEPAIGIKFQSYQNGPAIPDQYDGEMNPFGWYKLAAGFMFDPTPTRFIAAPDTLYRSSVWYQDYYYNGSMDGNIFYATNRLPIVGGSGKYACATGEISTTFFSTSTAGGVCDYDFYRLRICNTCPDPEEDYE